MSQSHMIYEDYREVALKHLRTCEYMKDYLQNVTNVKKKNAILRNIYYLSGYILEGVLNFLIYKTIKNNQPRQNVEPLFINRLNKWICYNFPNNFQRRQYVNLPEYFHLRITSHKFQDNKEIILDKLNTIQNTDFPYIDYLLDRPNIRSTSLYKSFKNWSHNTIRYQTMDTNFENLNIAYNENDILDFLKFAKETYRFLNSHTF